MKHRGDQRIRKSGTPAAQQDSAAQSPLSSNPKASKHQKETRSAKGVHASSPQTDDDLLLLADGNGDGSSEKGQQMLATPPTDGMSDVQPQFDLSFLDDIGHQTGDQDGDEIPQYLPPTDLDLDFICPLYDSPSHQSQDSPLFDIVPANTPTSLNLSTFPSTTLPSHDSCQCLALVVFAVEEFEAACNSSNRAELDSIISYQKIAIKSSRSMLKCSNCMSKRENFVLLVFVTEKIVAACSRITVLYRMKDNDGDTNMGTTGSLTNFAPLPSGLVTPPSSISEPSRTDFLHSRSHSYDDSTSLSLALALTTRPSTSNSTSTAPSTAPSIISTTSTPNWRELLLGDYEISSPLEWEHLVRVLIALQLRALRELLGDMKCLAWKALGETQTASLARAERRVGELEREIAEV